MQFQIFTPTEYLDFLNEGLGDYSAVLEGEISEYRVSQGKWIFFKLKDENSIVECFSTVFKLKTPLEDGMNVRLFGVPKVRPQSGRFSLNVDWVEAQGEGALKRAFELLKSELEKEGFFAKERKREIPKFPKKIGLIASKESAAYKDFIKILSDRFPAFEIFLYDVSVQGEGSVDDIVLAFSFFNENKEKLNLDLIVLTRGGGSLEDLKSFNSKEVAQAVFGSVFPVICGVGHEQDFSLADYVADIRASTPSNAAEIISPQKNDVLNEINSKLDKIEYILKGKIEEFDIDILLYKIIKNFDFSLNFYKGEINRKTGILESFLYGKIRKFSNLESSFNASLNIFEQRLIMQKRDIEAKIKLLKNLSPKAILKKGYAMVSLKGKILSGISSVKKKDKLDIFMYDGSFKSEVLSIIKKKKDEEKF